MDAIFYAGLKSAAWTVILALAAAVAVLGFIFTLYLHGDLGGNTDFAGNFINFILFISYWITPFVGVVLADWWLRGRSADPTSVVDFARLPPGTVALVALVAGFVKNQVHTHMRVVTATQERRVAVLRPKNWLPNASCQTVLEEVAHRLAHGQVRQWLAEISPLAVQQEPSTVVAVRTVGAELVAPSD